MTNRERAKAIYDYFNDFPVECDSEDCGCPCFDYCKDKMYSVDHFCCDDVYRQYMKEKEDGKKTHV